MPIKISTRLASSIASANDIEKNEVEKKLKEKSGNNCHLCGGTFNYASDDIEVDHDVPVDSGGDEKLSNLHLAHVECNRFKRAQGSRDVRQFLRFKRFYTEQGGAIDYAKALGFFSVVPKPSIIDEKKSDVAFQFPDGSKRDVSIFKTVHDAKTFKFCFVEVPIGAIFNDEECQPRLIKLNHLFSIASDLSENPLHEAPTCRIDPITQDGECRILLFDGQHKALATWLRGEKTIALKIYLNLTRQQATTLVNSIQSKIKKLPLTPFELASKLSDEYSDRLGHYEASAGEDNVSEEGFVEWLPASDRKNAKKEIEAAILKEVADDPTFLFPKIVEMRGRKVSEPWKITETNFHNKFLKELAYTQPLPASYFKGSAMQAARIKERENIITILNLLFDKVYGSLDVNSSLNCPAIPASYG